MPKEIERKFLVADDSWREHAGPGKALRQAILFSEGSRSIRVRTLSDAEARLTIKIGINGVSRHDYEYDVPLADAEELLDLANGGRIAKTRYEVNYQGYVWEIDVYEGGLEGLVVAEVELSAEDEIPAFPCWLGREVTEDKRFPTRRLPKAAWEGTGAMDYSIDFTESLESQVRRIARRRLEDAALLLDDMPDGTDKAIHGARKHIKQCRALYRLVAGSAKEFQQAENQGLGDIARELSHLRDAAALMEVTEYLKREIGSKANAMLMDRLAKRLERRHRHLTGKAAEASEVLHKASRDLRQAASDVDRLDLPNGPRKGADCVVIGWEKVGRKARRAIASAASGDHEEAFHDMRKRSQDRWMHAALLNDLWPTAMISVRRQAKGLSDLLGHIQDLSVLDEAITTAPELVQDNVENEAVRDAIRTQQAKLRGESLEQAGDLFRKSKPRDGKVIGHLIRKRAGE